MNPHPSSPDWVEPIRQIHLDHFSDPWQDRIDVINHRSKLNGSRRLMLPHPTLPPPWFNGDIENLPSGDWVLVVSLNPHVDPADGSLHGRAFTPDEWWDYWRFFNRDPKHWKGPFFPRLANLAAACLGESSPTDLNDFAMRRMLFVEFCPYASTSFASGHWHTVKRVAAEDEGFRISRRIRDLIFTYGQPRLALCNGQFAAWDVKDHQCPEMIGIHLTRREDHSYWMDAWAGEYLGPLENIPVVGFKQLGRRNSPSTIEVEIIRRYVHGDRIDVRPM